jgi:AraC-like DNA-binding protein
MEIVSSVSATMKHFLLDEVKARWRRQYWEETFNAIHPQSSAILVDEAQFHGRLSWRQMGGLLLCDISSAPQRVCRQSRHIRHGERDVIQLNLQLEGEGRVTQDGRECVTRPGEIVLYDSARPYELFYDRPFRQLYVDFPRELFRDRFGPTEHVTARTIDGTSGVGRFLLGYVKALVLQSEEDDSVFCDRLQTHFVDLLVTAVSALPRGSEAPVGFGRAMTLCRAKSYIADKLGDEALSPASVAEALGVSRRYLYDLFADEDIPVAYWIRRKRLERCRSDIENSALSTRSLSEIAFSWGFSDAAHFSRSFRNYYGMSPKGCRAAKQASAVAARTGARSDNF